MNPSPFPPGISQIAFQDYGALLQFRKAYPAKRRIWLSKGSTPNIVYVSFSSLIYFIRLQSKTDRVCFLSSEVDKTPSQPSPIPLE